MSTFLDDLTPEEIAARDAKAIADRDEALRFLAALLTEAGAPAEAVSAVLPALNTVLAPKIERMTGILVGGMLSPSYAYHNPIKHDRSHPMWEAYEDRERIARTQIHPYVAVRMRSEWIVDTSPNRSSVT